ncbi:hypothetical protein Slin15195_G116900 [Septoria linicola]|uniref:Carboxylesterase family protein n=1 Tax=Septoria linicola TaxID=215465 RepID=A0A9Q9B773_9PEZI|nr:hypothetical protein Slin14017_G093900 [Septoria linicola]USW58371.1 hypothetical protein Slin15195_G116900 [Septoria linicola]
MGRMTRAKAAAVAEELQIDQDALLAMDATNSASALSPTPRPEERGPLCDISPNSTSSKYEAEVGVQRNTTTEMSNMNNKNARSDKNINTLDASTASTASAQDEESPEVIPDEVEVAQSPASQAASDDLLKDIQECQYANMPLGLEASHLPVHDIRPTTPPSSAVRLTRQQLRDLPSDLQAAEQGSRGLTQGHSINQESSQDGTPQEPVQTSTGNVYRRVSFVDPPVPETMPNVLQINPQTPSRSSNSSAPHCEAESIMNTTNAENVDPNGEYDQLERAVVDASTPPKSNPKSPRIPAPKPTYDQLETAVLSASNSPRHAPSPMSADDPIEALDAQDDAVERIAAEVPDFQDSPQKPKSKKAVPAVRTTKASQARISLAHGLPDAPSKAPAVGRPGQSMSQSTSKRITSTSSAKSAGAVEDELVPEKKEVVIPHSKPRPMSMQFKAPPPLAKSTKAPTQSNFQLPGEAVAAKLKAAREARLQKEAESQQKKAFKARPAPSMSKAPAVRQTSTSKARESIINGKPFSASVGPVRPKSVATSRPGNGARSSMSTARPTSAVRPSTAPKTAGSRLSAAPTKTKDIAVTKRPSTVLGTSTSRSRPSIVMGMASRPRTSLAPKPNPPAAPARPTFQAGKGKEVFQRAAQAKTTAEQQKREREEAAKQARAAASERSRQLSREWAEKQKMKKSGVKPPAAALNQGATVAEAENAEAGAAVVV